MTATINDIKAKFHELVGEDIVITVEAGRRRTIKHEGILTEAYPSVFVVKLNQEKNDESFKRVSFNYIDVLTNSIEVSFPEALEVLQEPELEPKEV